MRTTIKVLAAGIMFLSASGFTTPEKDTIQNTRGTFYIEDEDFASNPFSFPLNGSQLTQRYGSLFTVAKEAVVNIHNSDITDTIYTFQFHKTSISFYRTEDQELLQGAVIRDRDIVLKRDVNIGMSKKEFAKGFHNLNGEFPDYIEVGNAENTSVYSFTFKNGVLSEVRYSGYVD